MALHTDNEILALKWAYVFIKNGYTIDYACVSVTEWYEVDPELIKDMILNGVRYD